MAEPISFSDFIESHAQASLDRFQFIISSLEEDTLSRGRRDDLSFPSATRIRIGEAYKQLRRGEWQGTEDDLDFYTDSFVDQIQDVARTTPQLDQYTPEKQRERKEALASVAKHVNALADLMEKLDSPAAGWLLAQFIVQHDRSKDAENDPQMAQAMALHIRKMLRGILPDLGLAAAAASNSLPIADRKDFRFLAAVGVEHVLFHNTILHAFTPERSSLGWLCLSEVLALLGEADAEKVRYWIEKTIEHPESQSNLVARLRARK